MTIIAGLALNRYMVMVEKARAHEAAGFLSALAGAQSRYAIEHENSYTSSLAELDLSTGSVPTKYFSITLEASATPDYILNERLAYMSRNSTLRISEIGGYTLSVCENGKIYCTDGTVDDCTKLGWGTSRTTCP